jgi:hypothetical protein
MAVQVSNNTAVWLAVRADEDDVHHTTSKAAAVEDLSLDLFVCKSGRKAAQVATSEAQERIGLIGHAAFAWAEDPADGNVFHARDEGASGIIFLDMKYNRELIELP